MHNFIPFFPGISVGTIVLNRILYRPSVMRSVVCAHYISVALQIGTAPCTLHSIQQSTSTVTTVPNPKAHRPQGPSHTDTAACHCTPRQPEEKRTAGSDSRRGGRGRRSGRGGSEAGTAGGSPARKLRHYRKIVAHPLRTTRLTSSTACQQEVRMKYLRIEYLLQKHVVLTWRDNPALSKNQNRFPFG